MLSSLYRAHKDYLSVPHSKIGVLPVMTAEEKACDLQQNQHSSWFRTWIWMFSEDQELWHIWWLWLLSHPLCTATPPWHPGHQHWCPGYTQVPPIDLPLFLVWIYANACLTMGEWRTMGTQQTPTNCPWLWGELVLKEFLLQLHANLHVGLEPGHKHFLSLDQDTALLWYVLEGTPYLFFSFGIP